MKKLRVFRSLLRRFASAPRETRALVLEALWRLALARAVLLLLPFRVVAARMGKAEVAAVPAPVFPYSPSQQHLAREISWAVTRTARYVPFRAVCLQQAVAAKAMLQRRAIHSILHFGVASGAKDMAAHAWLDAAEVEVTGFPVGGDIVEVARFV